jgi:hypothetical protein
VPKEARRACPRNAGLPIEAAGGRGKREQLACTARDWAARVSRQNSGERPAVQRPDYFSIPGSAERGLPVKKPPRWILAPSRLQGLFSPSYLRGPLDATLILSTFLRAAHALAN